MHAGEVRKIEAGRCEDLYLIETGMYDVSGYGCVYVLEAERPSIVETGIGTNVEAILDALDELNIPRSAIEVIAVTHVHLDHAGGAGHLANACEGASVAVHEIGAPHLVDPGRLIEGTKRAVGDQWKFYTEPRPVPESRARPLIDGDVIDLGDHALEAMHVPGHAPHQVAFYDPKNDAIFTGDSAGIWVPATEQIHQTSPPPNFDLEQAVADLDRIRAVGPRTLLYTHFGPRRYQEAMMDEYAETLSNWVRAVEAAAEELGGDVDAIVPRFAAQHDLDQVWGERKATAELRLNVEGVLTYLANRRS